MRIARFAFAASIAFGLAEVTFAAPCAGFSDVDTTSGFCVNVEWIKNRNITLGCTAGTFCPNTPVSRLQMAVFLNRLGNVLTPSVSFSRGSHAGPIVMGARPCISDVIAAAPYSRTAIVDTWATFFDPDVRVTLVLQLQVSTDGGSTWDFFGANAAETVEPPPIGELQARNAATSGLLELEPATTYRFAAGVFPSALGAGTVNISCALRTHIVHGAPNP